MKSLKIILIVAVVTFLIAPVWGQTGRSQYMTLDDILTRTLNYAAGYANPVFRDVIFDSTTAIENINAAQENVAKLYYATEAVDYIGLSADTNQYAFHDSDIQEIKVVYAINPDSGTMRPLFQTEQDKFGTQGSATGRPKIWMKWDNMLWVAPVNYDDDSLIVFYYRRANVLGEDTSAAVDTSNLISDFLDLVAMKAAQKMLVAEYGSLEQLNADYNTTVNAMMAKEEANLAYLRRPLAEKVKQ
jgi:hypothetical protein